MRPIRSILHPLRLAPLALAAACAVAGCRRPDTPRVNNRIDPGKIPTMTTRNVATLISDSGIVQYKIVAPLWYVYDEVDTPFWSFPKGLYLEKYDRNLKVTASVACDSATYLKRQQLWRLDGHVEMHNAPSDVFLTQQLFWDQRSHTIRSDSFIHVETRNRVIEGYGFHSNEKLTAYRVLRPSGIFPVESPEHQTAPGATAPDGPMPASMASRTVLPETVNP